MEKNGKWYSEIEYMRGFAVLGVVAIHTFGYFSHNEVVDNVTSFAAFIDALSLASVPLFAFISGFVLTKGASYEKSWFKFLSHRLRRIIIPYLLFSFIYLLYFHLLDKTALNWDKFVRDLFVGGAAFHLYFVPIIIELYLIYHVSYKLVTSFGKVHKLLFPFIALLLQYSWTYDDLLFRRSFFNPFSSFPLAPTVFSFTQVYFYYVLGIYIATEYNSFNEVFSDINIWAVIVSAVGLTLIYAGEWLKGIEVYGSYYKIPTMYFFPTRLLLPITNLSLFGMWLKLATLLKNKVYLSFFKMISYYSFDIYLIHVMFNDLIVRLMSKVAITSDRWTFYVILYFSTLIASFFVVKFVSKFSVGRILMGRQA